jgi:hypothetical protein
MNLWKPIALVSTTTLFVLISCGGARSGPGVATAGAGQPHMEAAGRHLREARQNLANAEHNKGGHRARAMELVDQAIGEVDKGIAYAE